MGILRLSRHAGRYFACAFGYDNIVPPWAGLEMERYMALFRCVWIFRLSRLFKMS